jgi:hypothetical protein
LKPLDYAALALSVGVAVFFAVTVYGSDVQPSLVSIESQGGTEVYPLDEERTVGVEGPLGTTHVHVDGEGSAAVIESPCPNKLCIQAGELSHRGDWSACMPNKIFVRIDGGSASESDVDAAVY